MKNNFDLRKFLIENKITTNAQLFESNIKLAVNSLEFSSKMANEFPEAFLEKYDIDTKEQAIELLKALRKEYNDWAFQGIAKAIKDKFGAEKKDAADLTVGGKSYSVGELDPNDIGTITDIDKYSNGYFISAVVYGDDDGEKYEKEGYGYAIDLDGNEMEEEDLKRD